MIGNKADLVRSDKPESSIEDGSFQLELVRSSYLFPLPILFWYPLVRFGPKYCEWRFPCDANAACILSTSCGQETQAWRCARVFLSGHLLHGLESRCRSSCVKPRQRDWLFNDTKSFLVWFSQGLVILWAFTSLLVGTTATEFRPNNGIRDSVRKYSCTYYHVIRSFYKSRTQHNKTSLNTFMEV